MQTFGVQDNYELTVYCRPSPDGEPSTFCTLTFDTYEEADAARTLLVKALRYPSGSVLRHPGTYPRWDNSIRELVWPAVV